MSKWLQEALAKSRQFQDPRVLPLRAHVIQVNRLNVLNHLFAGTFDDFY